MIRRHLNNLARRSGLRDPGLLLALTLALMAAMPFLTRPDLPRGTDAELHVFRAAELGNSLGAGILYPRWAPDFYYGYGYPIFNYYAPLTYYLASLFHCAPGIDIVGGVKLVFILGLVGAATGTYLFVRDLFGPRASLLSAALYVFSPYVFFVDPHMRGVLAESFVLGVFPLTLWTFYRLLVDGRRRWLFFAAILQAALIASHNLLGAVFSAVLVAFLAWELAGRVIRSWRQAGGRTALARWGPVVGRVLLGIGLGVGMSAIHWLPVALERGAVQLNLTGPGHFDFHNHFVPLGELLAPSLILDLGATAPHFGFNLGLAQWPLALLVLPAIVWGAPGRRRLAGFFLLCSIGLVVLMLAASAPIWEIVPGMNYLQFPWRLLGPAAAMLSFAAAAGYALLDTPRFTRFEGVWQSRWTVATLGLGIGLALCLALPTMFPPMWQADFGPTDPAAIIAFELTGVAVGTTSTGDYLPITVEKSPHPESAYVSTYTSQGGVDKVNRATLPAGTIVEMVSHGPTHDRFKTTSSTSFILRLFTFNFPGWRATIDGDNVPIELGRPEGFITVKVPSGTHMVEVRLGALATRPRALGTLISLFSVVGVLLVGWQGWHLGVSRLGLSILRPARRKEPPCSTRGDLLPDSAALQTEETGWCATFPRLDLPASRIAGGVILLFFVFKVGWVDGQHDWFRRSSPPGQVLGAQHSLADERVDFGHHIQLLGYDLPKPAVRAGEELSLVLYWLATNPVPKNYQVFAHLTRPTTHLWGQSDNLNPGDLPTRRWPLDKYVRDEHELHVLSGTPPGDYQLTVGLYTLTDGARVPVFDDTGAFVGDTVALQTPVRVAPSHHPPKEEDLGMTEAVNAGFGGELTLLGAVLPDRIIELPGFIHLALLWRAEVDSPNDVTVRVQVLDSAGDVAHEIVTQPVDGQYPSPVWSAGEIVRDQYSVWLPEQSAPGSYKLRVGLQEFDGWLSLGQIQVVGR